MHMGELGGSEEAVRSAEAGVRGGCVPPDMGAETLTSTADLPSLLPRTCTVIFICMDDLPPRMSLHHCVPWCLWRPEESIQSLELELQTVVSGHLSAGH